MTTDGARGTHGPRLEGSSSDQRKPSSATGGAGGDFWWAHDQPERPFDRGVFLCGCPGCALALKAASLADPAFRLVVRGEHTRRSLTVAEAAAASIGDGLAALAPDDRLRDVCAAAYQEPPAMRTALARLDARRSQGVSAASPPAPETPGP